MLQDLEFNAPYWPENDEALPRLLKCVICMRAGRRGTAGLVFQCIEVLPVRETREGEETRPLNQIYESAAAAVAAAFAPAPAAAPAPAPAPALPAVQANAIITSSPVGSEVEVEVELESSSNSEEEVEVGVIDIVTDFYTDTPGRNTRSARRAIVEPGENQWRFLSPK